MCFLCLLLQYTLPLLHSLQCLQHRRFASQRLNQHQVLHQEVAGWFLLAPNHKHQSGCLLQALLYKFFPWNFSSCTVIKPVYRRLYWPYYWSYYCAFTHILLVNGGISRLDGVALRLCGTTIPLYDNWEQPRFHNLMRLKPIELAHTKFNVIKGNIFNN